MNIPTSARMPSQKLMLMSVFALAIFITSLSASTAFATDATTTPAASSTPAVNHAPTIALVGDAEMYLHVGDTFTDPGVTTSDADGDTVTVATQIAPVAPVSTAFPSTFSIFYTATDSQGASSAQVSRTIHISAAITTATTTASTTASTTTSGGTGSTGGSTPPATPSFTIIANAITCDSESALPNWGDNQTGPNVTASTASSFVASHPTCRIATGWNFQWGLGFGLHDSRTASDPGKAFIGTTPGGSGTTAWNTFGPTNSAGVASTSISNLQGASDVWVREALQSGYVPFAESGSDNLPSVSPSNFSAEMYCNNDVFHYDNYDAVYNAQMNNTYYCVAFNALATSTNGGGSATNTPPAITILGNNPATTTVNTTYTDAGATATDAQDGDLTSKIIASSTVSTSTIGTYTVTYSVTDSGGLTATSTRTVNVVAAGNNGGGGTATNTPPVITILGDNPATTIVNSDYNDAGATATDAQDGDLTSKIIASSTVSTTTIGTYTVTYSVTDSGGLTSTSTRTVNVVDQSNGGGGGGTPGGGGGGSSSNGGPNFGIGGGFSTPLLASGGTTAVGNTALTCPLLNSYLRYGANNDPTEVVKLQAFLQRTEGYDVDVTGTFDLKTLAGVNAFQTKYLNQVMGPWGASQPSGYVYITTRKKINEIACDTAFYINPSEQAIINAYKAAVANGTTTGQFDGTISSTSPDIGFNGAPTSTTNVAANGFFSNPNTAGAANASILQRFWQFLLNLFKK